MSEISAYPPSAYPSQARESDRSIGASSESLVAAREKKVVGSTSVVLTLSAESIERIKRGDAEAPPLTQEEKDKYAEVVNALRTDYYAGLEKRTPRLGHALYRDMSVSYLNDFRTFFAYAEGESSQAIEALSDKLFAAVSNPPSDATDTTSAIGLALQQAKLEYLNRAVTPQAHQANVSADINNYMNERVALRERAVYQRLEAELFKDQFPGNQVDQALIHARLDALKEGTEQAQQEMTDVLSLAMSSQDPTETVNALSQWYAQRSVGDETEDKQFDALLKNWQQFVQMSGV